MGEEYLEDGAGLRTPAGDNLLLGFARTQAEAYAVYADSLDGARHHEHADLGLVMQDTGSASPFGNNAMLLRPVANRTGEVLQALAAFFSGRDGGPFILFSPWPTADLRSQGLHLVGHPPLMLRPAAARPEPHSGLRIVPVQTLEQLDDFERVLVDGFPVEEMQPWRPRCFLGPSVLETAWRLFVGYDGDRAVATAATYRGEVSIVEQVAVLPEARGRGYGFDITAAATAEDVPTLLIASDPGQSVYERLGYLRLLRYTLWLGMR